MPISVKASNTQTAVINTEHVLLTTGDDGTYQFFVDVNAMTATDVLELRIKTSVLVAGTIRGCYKQTLRGAQNVDGLIFVSVPISTDLGADFTLKQTAGTGRNFPWKVLSI